MPLRKSGSQAIVALLTLISVALPLEVAGTPAQGAPVEVKDLRDLERAFVQLADSVRQSTVVVRTFGWGSFVVPGGEVRRRLIPNSHGSGAIIRSDGYILTSAHVGEGADQIQTVLHDGRELEARLVQADQRRDLAVLRVDAVGLTPVRYGEYERIHLGQWCFAVGNPFGLSNLTGRTAISYGIVEALGRDLSDELNAEVSDERELRYYGNLIQTSAAINPGNSGGPLFNIDGQMIGIVTAIESRSGVSEGLGFAIPIDDWSRRIIQQLVRGQEVKHGFLGVMVQRPARADLAGSGSRAPRGAEITGFTGQDSPALKAGLRKGDIIVEFAGEPIGGTEELVGIVGATPIRKPAKVVYLRDGRRRTLNLTLAAREVTPLRMGGGAEDAARTYHWRGAWLQEPTPALLRAYGLDHAIGLVVVDVDPGSDAARAKLERESLILAVNRRRVGTIEDFEGAIQKAGEAASLRVHTEDGVKVIRMPSGDGSL